MIDPAILKALEDSLRRDPRNGALWLHYADLLEQADRHDDALAGLRTAAELPECRQLAAPRLIEALLAREQLAEALIRAESFLESRDDPRVRVALARIHLARGQVEAAQAELERLRRDHPDSGADLASLEQALDPATTAADVRAEIKSPLPAAIEAATAEPDVSDDWARQFDWGDLKISFDDVVGLDEVKRQIRLRIIAPTLQPEVYAAFGRDGGGGLLLYGPPGCGKTFIARAIAGELGARFCAVSIHDIVDKYWGESEKAIHALFEEARQASPTVLFFDEFDALGSKRGQSSQFWRTLVDQMLQEMDGVDARNRDVLLVAATNEPWNVDTAFRRPGRFDRVIFVPPPDVPGRREILERYSRSLPGREKLDFTKILARTELFTGADLKALCDRAAEEPLERSLMSGEVHEVTTADFEGAVAKTSSSALEWISHARNHARYGNDGGHYDELVAWLKAIKKW